MDEEIKELERELKMLKRDFSEKLLWIEGQIIRIDYANRKIDEILDYITYESRSKYPKYSTMALVRKVRWYRSKIDYHHHQLLNHLTIKDKKNIIGRAEKETASLIQKNIVEGGELNEISTR